jgi:hypothetical protein
METSSLASRAALQNHDGGSILPVRKTIGGPLESAAFCRVADGRRVTPSTANWASNALDV